MPLTSRIVRQSADYDRARPSNSILRYTILTIVAGAALTPAWRTTWTLRLQRSALCSLDLVVVPLSGPVVSFRLRTATLFLQVLQDYFTDLESPFLASWKL